MRIGIDIDGVLAAFTPDYVRGLNAVSGRRERMDYAPTRWNFEADLGFTPEDVRAAWKVINKSARFWYDLAPMAGAAVALKHLYHLSEDHEVYFLTSRTGLRVKAQTEAWLVSAGFGSSPTVMICHDKAAGWEAVALDAYIDDRLKNVNAVMGAVRAGGALSRVYLHDASYNQRPVVEDGVTAVGDEVTDPAARRVGGVMDMLAQEGLV